MGGWFNLLYWQCLVMNRMGPIQCQESVPFETVEIHHQSRRTMDLGHSVLQFICSTTEPKCGPSTWGVETPLLPSIARHVRTGTGSHFYGKSKWRSSLGPPVDVAACTHMSPLKGGAKHSACVRWQRFLIVSPLLLKGVVVDSTLFQAEILQSQ